MTEHSRGEAFSSRIRLSILEADWRRIAEQLTEGELRRFSSNPLFAINAIAGEFGCELSSVRWDNSVDVRFVKRYGRNKEMWNVLLDRDVLMDPPRLEAVLRATLPGQVAAANDWNTIREYFGPAVSR